MSLWRRLIRLLGQPGRRLAAVRERFNEHDRLELVDVSKVYEVRWRDLLPVVHDELGDKVGLEPCSTDDLWETCPPEDAEDWQVPVPLGRGRQYMVWDSHDGCWRFE